LQAYEAQLDALASGSMDQNFTDELQAIESCQSKFLPNLDTFASRLTSRLSM
jgi:hypothetical protein